MSSAPGWYPDPEDSSRVRYWDGDTWSAPTARSGAGSGGGSGGLGRRWLLLVLALVVGLVLVFLVPRLFGGQDVAQPDPDPTGPRPTESQWDELPVTESPTPTPSDSPSSGEEVVCPSGDPEARNSVSDGGWIRGGGLAFRDPGEPWGPLNAVASNIPWAHDADGLRSSGSVFYNVMMVGELHATEGFTDPKSAAHMAFDCQASGAYYTGVEQVEVLLDEAIEVGGVQGWHVRGLVHSTSGLIDRVDAIVIDGGAVLPTFHAVVNSEVPEHVVGVDEAIASLQYEG